MAYSPGRLVLIRHGESECNLRGVVGGQRGCTGLSARGAAQAKALRSRLERTGELHDAAVLYTSVLARAVETAEILSDAIGGLTAVQDCGLCELHPGDADGLSWEEATRRYGSIDFRSDPTQPIAPSGESWVGFVERATANLTRIMEAHAGELVVIVCHAGVAAASLARFLGIPGPSAGLGLRCENTSLTCWERDCDRAWRLVSYNDAAHLAEL